MCGNIIYNNREAYAKYDLVKSVSYNIISHLINSDKAEVIWKLLKNDSNDAWNVENLTKEEKRKLIYDGSKFAANFRVFIDEGMDDAVTGECTFLRIYPYYITPSNRTNGVVDVAFEILSHYKTNTMSNYSTKVDTIFCALIDSLNGVDIGGIGPLFFDTNGSRLDKAQTIGSSPYRGKILVMSVNVG